MTRIKLLPHTGSNESNATAIPDRDRSQHSRSGLLFPEARMGGIRVQALTAPELLAVVGEAVRTREKRVIANHNMHSLYLWHRDKQMREFYAQADFTHVDGVAPILLFRWFGGQLTREHRTTYIDFLQPLAEQAASRHWKIYYLGSTPDTGQEAAARLRRCYPGLQLRTHHGYFDTSGLENEAVLADIRAYDPDVLLVGMGMPRQEKWISENLGGIHARAIFCVGCLMEYVAGSVPTCPRWLSAAGFEWLYRLLAQPGRLWSRYLVEPWFVMSQVCATWLKERRSLRRSIPLVDGSD